MEEESGSVKRLLVACAAIFVFIVICAFAWRAVSSWSSEKIRLETSDATDITATLRIAIDSYGGYWAMVSPEMRGQARSRGIALEFIVEPDYKKRVELLHQGKVDIIFIPISSYVEHGRDANYPGVAYFALAGSNGADSIWTYKKNIPTGKVTDLNDSSLRWYYVGGTVSETLVDATVHTLELGNLAHTNIWRKPVDTIEQVIGAAETRQGDVFVLWEPEATRAAQSIPDLVRVWGTDKQKNIVKDVGISLADYVASNRPVLEQFLEAYFRTLQIYDADRDRMIGDMARTSNMDEATVRKVMTTIDYYDLRENATLQFGIPVDGFNNPSEGMFTTISDSVELFRKTGKFPEDPLRGNYVKLTYKKVLQDVLARMPVVANDAGAVKFSPLSDEQWKNLHEVATLRIDPIQFASGVDTLSDEGKTAVDSMVEEFINHFPTGRIAVRGYTDLGSNAEESVALSSARAESVVQRFVAVHGFDRNRLHAEGYGFSVPPARRDGESERAYRNRWPRVEFVLLEDESF